LQEVKRLKVKFELNPVAPRLRAQMGNPAYPLIFDRQTSISAPNDNQSK
jgi:hypothetical protein